MEKLNLYFIALIPHQELRDEITELKEEMKILSGAKDILKSPAHITLQKPFKRKETEEPAIVKTLRGFASEQSPFSVNLDGFGSFPPRVIFIQITDHKPIIDLHASLKRVLLDRLAFTRSEILEDIHPHITLTTRYLTLNGFNDAWPEFKNREFTGSFEAGIIYLLKHNGHKWEIINKFRLGNCKEIH